MAINSSTGPTGGISPLTRRKLEAFAAIEEDFVASFSFAQAVHGQERFAAFSVADVVRYLHALYICERKDRLLSVYKNIERYEGARCLELLRGWQEEGSAVEVVAFLQRKLDTQPFAQLTQQIEAATRTGDVRVAGRLISGRAVLLNRSFNLARALDAVFALEPERLRDEVRMACERNGHTPGDIDRELAELRSELCAYAPHPELARRNMLVMNRLGPQVMDAVGDRPGARTDRVLAPTLPAPPYAEQVIPGAMTLSSMGWNNPRHLDLANPPLRVDAPDSLGRYPIVPPDAT